MRRNTYGDVTQGHVEEEIAAALKAAGNDVAIALEILKAAASDQQMFQPPAWIEDGVITKGEAFNHRASSVHMAELVKEGHIVEKHEKPVGQPPRSPETYPAEG